MRGLFSPVMRSLEAGGPALGRGLLRLQGEQCLVPDQDMPFPVLALPS